MITFHEYSPWHSKAIPALHKLSKFPAGEATIGLSTQGSLAQVAFVQNFSHDDLFSLAMWANACHNSRLQTVLLLPYLPGARADRGSPLGAKVYADFINSLGIDIVVCVDPHSDVAPALYERLTCIPLEQLPHWEMFGHYAGVIAPDIGARRRAEGVANVLRIPVFQAMKHRDFKTGKLSGFTCEALQPMQPYLVVDDICDGGGTFLGLADAVPDALLSLWVTHGVFSNGAIHKLSGQYRKVFTTDSFNNSEYSVRIPLFETMLATARNLL